MITQIQGLHHVTSLAKDAQKNNNFFTKVLGLRRVKKTVNFDAPHLYHLYFGNANGSPGTVMTYFPNPNAKTRRRGSGEVGQTAFSVPQSSLGYWDSRLRDHDIENIKHSQVFDESRLTFDGPDGEELALVESQDTREAWDNGKIPQDYAIRGFHSVTIRLAESSPMKELLEQMGLAETKSEQNTRRFEKLGGNGANRVDLIQDPNLPLAKPGAGAVHHLAFSVKDKVAQAQVRAALLEFGMNVTPVKDRDYFNAIYFRAPEGILFEVATDDPGFATDEKFEDLGKRLCLPAQHEHLRQKLEHETLAPISD